MIVCALGICANYIEHLLQGVFGGVAVQKGNQSTCQRMCNK